MPLDINKDAPKLAAVGVTKDDLEASAAKKPAPSKKPAPKKAYTKEVVIAIADDYHERGNLPPSTGLHEWANEHGITVPQVREIIAEIKRADAALADEN